MKIITFSFPESKPKKDALTPAAQARGIELDIERIQEDVLHFGLMAKNGLKALAEKVKALQQSIKREEGKKKCPTSYQHLFS